uniref:Uncharacterized protein n=1 Tax=Panagrolaimus sp. PS1159 TaxID=55785 RepID=A0AC35G6A3_9BILA
MQRVKNVVKEFQGEWLKGFTDLQEGYTTDGLPYAIYTNGIKSYKIRCVVNFETFVVPRFPFYPILVKEKNVSSWDDAKYEINKLKSCFSKGEYEDFFSVRNCSEKMFTNYIPSALLYGNAQNALNKEVPKNVRDVFELQDTVDED